VKVYPRDPYLKWVLWEAAEHCPSCLALEGQVHLESTWISMGLYPGSPLLYCCRYKDNCRCSLDRVDGPDEGSLLDLPILPAYDNVPEYDEENRRQKIKPKEEEEELSEGSMEDNEIRLQLEGKGTVNEAGRFDVLAITAGDGNGWQFSEAVLQESLPLWDGTTCFVDHGSWFGGRSVKDIAGVMTNPRWDETSKGVLMDLSTIGPAGELVNELGRQILSEKETAPSPSLPTPSPSLKGGEKRGEEPTPSPSLKGGEVGGKLNVGFSADVIFTALGTDVQKILRVLEVCLVYNPARGGAFVRALNASSPELAKHINGGGRMTESNVTNTNPPSQGGTVQEQLNKDVEAVRNLLAVQEERQRLAEEAEAARAVRLQMCAYLLESGIAAARLPQPMAEHVRKQFDGKLFEPTELTTAIDHARKLVSDLTAGGVVAGPGRIHGMFNSDDQLQAAVDDLLDAPRDDGAQALRVAKLGGVKELYMMLTGDRDLYGGYYADRVQLATTATFPGLVKNAMNKIIAQQWEQLGAAGYDWWERIVAIEHFNTLNQITGVVVGTVGTLPEVSEGAEYTELKIGDSAETADFTKYGGYIPLTLELIDRDNTRKLRQYPRELAKAGLRRVSALVAAVFTDNSDIGPTMADTGALFNATAVTTAGGHANLLTTALAGAQWDVVQTAVYNQPMLVSDETGYVGVGPAMAINPRYLVVPRALQLTAEGILYPYWDRASNVYSENLQRGQRSDVVVVPEWTDANNWAAVVDPNILAGIVVGERFGIMPEIFVAGDELSPAVFMNDEHRIKVRHFVAVLVQDYRPLHKSNVA
jgi:hypothetical protein